ncbi:unnamed protein product [Paramecium pentaurelia]|uniref:SP-RING-type domain-containing protein n=1 Tax=Paramecium pentaurelia TaxID=43138 RepID=A0A8S1WN67_9CILI|nr:unnamed protein product [Paramecium pentaurelia]
MQKQCYCEQQNSLDSFSCINCKRYSHWPCYDYQITDKQPLEQRCVDCTFQASNPFKQIEHYVRFNNKKNKIFQIGKTVQEQQFMFTFEVNKYYDDIKKNQIILSIFCIKMKEQKQLFVWPNNNIEIWFNEKYQIKYHETDFAYVSPNHIVSGQNSIKLIFKDKNEFNSLFGIVLVKNIEWQDVKQQIIHGDKDQIEQIITQQKVLYFDKINKPNENQEECIDIQVQSNLSINLLDPFTSQQLQLPARGKHCQHINCFDLNSFLIFNSQPNKSRWSCPYCHLITTYDQIQIDYLQVRLLQDIKIDHPNIYYKIQRVIINQKFQYQIDPKSQIEHIQSKQSILNSQNLTQLIKINNKTFDFENNQIQFEIVELQKRNNYTSSYITFKSAKKLIQKIKQKELLKNIVRDATELVNYFCNLFDIKYYDKFNIFDSQIDMQFLESQQDFELICKAIYEKTVSGLFIYFIRYANPSLKILAQAIMQLCSHLKLQLKSNYQKKMLELFLAASYDKNERTSQGYNFKVICSLCKVSSDEYTNHLFYLSQKLKTIFYNINISSLFIVRNCINLSHMFDQDCIFNKIRVDQNIYEASIESIKEIYSIQMLKELPFVSDILALLLYLLYKKDKIYENIFNQFNDYNLGNVKKKFKNLEYKNDFCYL